jgi:hypothetical protein
MMLAQGAAGEAAMFSNPQSKKPRMLPSGVFLQA